MQKTFYVLTGITAIIASLSSGPISADTEFEDSIPIDLARALLRGVGNAIDVKIYSDIPDSFPAFELPAGATLMGSVDHTHNQQVVLQSDGDGLEQQSALIESLQNNGYTLIERMPFSTPQTGFVSASPQEMSFPTQLCSDPEELIHLRLDPEPERTFINITHTNGINLGNFSCADRLAQASNSQAFSPFASRSPGIGALRSSMPRLELPDDATLQAPYMPRFMSGSSDQMKSEIAFVVDWSLAEVQTFFAEQIAAQEWTLDSDSAGDHVALGAWTREDNDRLLLGTLQLVSKDDDLYEAVFAVSFLD